MADTVASPVAQALARTVGPDRDAILREMDRRADETGFPTVGPAVGGWLGMLTRLVDGERVFEFGSGFGYSAYWFARAVPAGGEVVLTELDADELEAARTYLERGELAERAVFEHGDAIEIVEEYEGPFDVVLIDNEKARYAAAFDAVQRKVRPGGLVLADNAVTAGSVDADDVLALARGDDVHDPTTGSEGIAEYLDRVATAGFETTLLPLGEGVAVSRKPRQHG